MNFPLFIAKRLYRDQGDKRKVSRPAIHIATAGVAIGLAIMVMSVCVVLGFKHTIRDKVIGFGSHIQVADFMTLQQQNQYPVVMNDSMVKVLQKIPGVKHVQRFAMKEGILKTDNDFLGVVLKVPRSVPSPLPSRKVSPCLRWRSLRNSSMSAPVPS